MLIVTLLIVQELEGLVKSGTIGKSCCLRQKSMAAIALWRLLRGFPQTAQVFGPLRTGCIGADGQEKRTVPLHLARCISAAGAARPCFSRCALKKEKTAPESLQRSGRTRYFWSWQQESNLQPADYKSAALPIELCQRSLFILAWQRQFVNVCRRVPPAAQQKIPAG